MNSAVDKSALSHGVEAQANALLLQGPVGPFFARIAHDLRSRNFNVFKINFNGGDQLFYSDSQSFEYTGTVENWSDYLERFILNKRITRLYLFGDCRCYHRIAKTLAAELGVRVFVFEEGYIRPNFITLEEGGVNGHSTLMQSSIKFSDAEEETDEAAARKFGFFVSAAYSMIYYWACAWHSRKFRHYQHHRPIGWLSEGGLWIRSALRKWIYRDQDRQLYQEIMSQFDGEYFLCPLQVHCDMQVLVHSKFNSIEHFIGEVLKSFAQHAPANKAIVFKHHPLDRGYTDYKRLIATLECELGLQGRVFYVHDVCLPSLLKNACGSVMINSTVGMSSLFHGTPVKVLGDAIYDKPELTSQLDLDEFWSQPGQVDASAFKQFRAYLVANNQLNGSLYLKIKSVGFSGVIWSKKLIEQHCADADSQHGSLVPSVPELRLVAGKDIDTQDVEHQSTKQSEPKKAA